MKKPTKTEVINLITTKIYKYKDKNKLSTLYQMKLEDLIDTYFKELKSQQRKHKKRS